MCGGPLVSLCADVGDIGRWPVVCLLCRACFGLRLCSLLLFIIPGNRSANSAVAKQRNFQVEYVSTYVSLSGKTSVM
jgi:hypothetical protein